MPHCGAQSCWTKSSVTLESHDWLCEPSCKQVTRTAIPFILFHWHSPTIVLHSSVIHPPSYAIFIPLRRSIITFLLTPYILPSSADQLICLVNPTDLHTRRLSVPYARLTLSASCSSSNSHLTGLSRSLGTV